MVSHVTAIQDRQYTYNLTLWRICATIVAVDSNEYYTRTTCVGVFVALGIQHAMRMCHIAVCGLPRSIIFFHIISQKARFSEKKVLNIKCVFRVSLQLLSEIFFILRRTERDIIEKM